MNLHHHHLFIRRNRISCGSHSLKKKCKKTKKGKEEPLYKMLKLICYLHIQRQNIVSKFLFNVEECVIDLEIEVTHATIRVFLSITCNSNRLYQNTCEGVAR